MAMIEQAPEQELHLRVAQAVEAACARIAPTWPLDRFAAVNPFWGFVDRPVEQAAGELARLSGAHLTMPRDWFREQWQAGRFAETHVRQALAERGSDTSVAEVLGALDQPAPEPPRFRLFSDMVDSPHGRRHHLSWSDFVTDHVSRHCAAYFDRRQARWAAAGSRGLYAAWRETARTDVLPEMSMGLKGFRAAATALPDDPAATILAAAEALPVPADLLETYFSAALLRINGWAAWCAYQRWQARLAGGDSDDIEQLLAIRLAWDCLLRQLDGDTGAVRQWQRQARRWSRDDDTGASLIDWVLQRALELAYQQSLAASLTADGNGKRAHAVASAQRPRAQAVFCIDTRSEVFRRALESTAPEVQTLGFAGFFGVPVAFTPLAGDEATPQLPVLFAPQWQAVERAASPGSTEDAAARRRRGKAWSQSWKGFRGAATSGFSFVEATGLFYLNKLLRATLAPVSRPRQGGNPGSALKPALAHASDSGRAVTLEDRIELADRVLSGLSLTEGFARLLLLVGHGSESVNNAHAAALDCGACGGQSGALNARLLAGVLNDPAVRRGLSQRGITLPADTHVLPCEHNTTTDTVTPLDTDEVPAGHRDDLAQVRAWLDAAGATTRTERAAALRRAQPGPGEQREAAEGRARDWSQLRPEWGLAGNAAFIIAPRTATRQIDLAGRAFLHEYRWQDDPQAKGLAQILSGPMIVTHWINMQYYASTVDNPRYGSGNKVLHNVVGGNIGVLEGNRGDLRIGLPLQSLRDGKGWMHTPLRLTVVVAAPRDHLDRVLACDERVAQLVDNQWLFLWCLDPADNTLHQRVGGAWRPAVAAE